MSSRSNGGTNEALSSSIRMRRSSSSSASARTTTLACWRSPSREYASRARSPSSVLAACCWSRSRKSPSGRDERKRCRSRGTEGDLRVGEASIYLAYLVASRREPHLRLGRGDRDHGARLAVGGRRRGDDDALAGLEVVAGRRRQPLDRGVVGQGRGRLAAVRARHGDGLAVELGQRAGQARSAEASPALAVASARAVATARAALALLSRRPALSPLAALAVARARAASALSGLTATGLTGRAVGRLAAGWTAEAGEAAERGPAGAGRDDLELVDDQLAVDVLAAAEDAVADLEVGRRDAGLAHEGRLVVQRHV